MDTFLSRPDNDLEEYKLSDVKWEALQKFEEILSVCISNVYEHKDCS